MVAGFIFLVFGGIFVFAGLADIVSAKAPEITIQPSVVSTFDASTKLRNLRRWDANFSEIVFTDFCYSLFAHLYEALGRGQIDRYAPYVDADMREELKRLAPAGLSSIDAIVVGSFTIAGVRGFQAPRVEIDVEYEANYTQTANGQTRRSYVRERWTLTRLRDVLSPAPANARAEHCPKCGAGLETRSDGACNYCGTVITDGTFHWFVRAIQRLAEEERPPQLGSSTGPEPGLDRPTVLQPWIGRHMKEFEEKHSGFTWAAFEERVRLVATELQNAWTSRDWSRARPFETDALFQTHRYWIEEYLRQGLRNVVDRYTITNVEIAKVTNDPFYDAVTVRLYASGTDYTVDEEGHVVSGLQSTLREWSEYWTFVRGRVAASADARVCPNCGGPREAGQTVICKYCGGKITTGEFPWVLSRIEQDEAYR